MNAVMDDYSSVEVVVVASRDCSALLAFGYVAAAAVASETVAAVGPLVVVVVVAAV
jgi:hypothetical protein